MPWTKNSPRPDKYSDTRSTPKSWKNKRARTIYVPSTLSGKQIVSLYWIRPNNDELQNLQRKTDWNILK